VLDDRLVGRCADLHSCCILERRSNASASMPEDSASCFVGPHGVFLESMYDCHQVFQSFVVLFVHDDELCLANHECWTFRI
jgi:hypothetical protein